MTVASYALLFASVVAVVSALPTQPADPVIGIITHPIDQCDPGPNATYDQCIESYYVRWLEASGVRVVAIPFNATQEVQEWFLNRVNGVLFQGGGLSGERIVKYIVMVTRILRYALERNANGDPFVVWGTCQGFQVLSAAAAGTADVIQGPYHGMYPRMMNINFTLAQPSSRLLGDANVPHDVRETLLTRNSTLNWHHEIITPQSFAQYPNLSTIFTPLSTDIVPGTNQEFISAFESPHAEVYAVQFHPERPPYEFSQDIITHELTTIAVSQYLADFIASRLRLNNHTFDSADQFERNRLGKWPLLDEGWGTRTYYIMTGDPVN
jgi:gamma-glutamyl hydrolase